ncbi:LLM class flavin-dependent oxidoreductase [Nocardioides panacis]|uniref:LLM class flavin-dependent oxidoreductase n=1 Tax=Nocardioides panacis TaxID=2849501 RepID=UPI003F57F090
MDLRVFTEPQQGATYDDLLAVARRAEELGFDAFFRSDHYLAMGGDGLPGPTDAWLTLAGLARDTSTIRLGTLMTSATFRLPGPLAISVAQVDQMSGGRVELGLGAGWFEAEHAAYGIPFPEAGERFDRLEETLAVVTGLWTTPVGETFSHAGVHYRLLDSPRAAQAGAVTAPAGDHRRARQAPHAGAGRALRRRVQRAVRVGRDHPGAGRPGAGGLRERGT